MEQIIIPSSYQELIKEARNYDHYSKPSANDLLETMGFHGLSSHAAAPIFYVVDYTIQKYLYVDPSCKIMLGYDSEMLLDAGPLFFTGFWHPNDFKIFNYKILPETLKFLQHNHVSDFHNYAFSFNYRFKIKRGIHITLLQRSTYFVATESGMPLAAVGFIVDISHFKEGTSIIHTIEKIDRNFSSLSTTPVLKSVYYPDDSYGILTGRELEILRCLHKGFSSKLIASQLSISINTVNNHRKKILKKTNSNNITELINFATRRGLL